MYTMEDIQVLIELIRRLDAKVEILCDILEDMVDQTI